MKNFHKEIIVGLLNKNNPNANIILARLLAFISPKTFNSKVKDITDTHFGMFIRIKKIESNFDFDELSEENQFDFKQLINDLYYIFVSSFRKVDIVDTLEKSTVPTSFNINEEYTEGEYSANGAMDMVIWEALNADHDLSIIFRTLVAKEMMDKYSIKNLRKNILD